MGRRGEKEGEEEDKGNRRGITYCTICSSACLSAFWKL